MMKKLFLLTVLLVLTSEGLTQPPPPAAKKPPAGETKKISGWPSIGSLPSTDPFVSLEGRFKIALPKDIQGFAALSPKQTGTAATGQQLTWKFAEAEIVGLFLDFYDSQLSGSAEELAHITTNSKKLFTDKWPNVKLLSESQTVVNRTPAANFVFDLGSEGIIAVQLFLDKKRLYRFNAQFKEPAIQERLDRIFKTFTLIPQTDVEAAIQKMSEAIKPPALPQSPIVAKQTSDLTDERLKGRVKRIVDESEDRSGTWGVQGRKISSLEYYDQNGALTQRDSYDSQGNPFQITVYGYIDSKRVSNSKIARYEYDPPPAAAPPPAANSVAKPKSDPRYEYSFEYRYENGKLVECQMLYNNGTKGMRYVYKHSPNQVEELVYTEEGKLNQRYLSILDASGFEIERTNFGLANFDIYGDRRYKHTYEFDAVGNWTKKITSKEVKENGVTSWQPAYISYRTITYY